MKLEKTVRLKKFKKIFPDWGKIPVGLCGWFWGENAKEGLNEYLYGVFNEGGTSNYETYIKLESALRGLNKELLKKAKVSYRIDEGELKYFYLSL